MRCGVRGTGGCQTEAVTASKFGVKSREKRGQSHFLSFLYCLGITNLYQALLPMPRKMTLTSFSIPSPLVKTTMDIGDKGEGVNNCN